MQNISNFPRRHQESAGIHQRQFTTRNFRKMLLEGVRGHVADETFCTWLVNSTTRPGWRYQITVNGSYGDFRVRCDCNAGANAKPCKHALYVLRAVNGNPWAAYAVELATEGKTVPGDVRAGALKGYDFMKEIEVL